MTNAPYAMTKVTGYNFEDADRRIREELQKEGFGVLTEIDVAATMKKKLDVDMLPYEILGACAPQLANGALSQEPAVGLLLPCNVVVRANREGDVVVEILDPIRQFSLSGNDALQPLAVEASARLRRALERV